MENNNGESCDGVRLIDASDSLKAVTLGENSAFMPSKVSLYIFLFDVYCCFEGDFF